jgi:hypothetical protein
LTASLCDAIGIPEPVFDGPLSAGTTHLLLQYRQAQTGPLVQAPMRIQVIDFNEYKTRKAAEQRELIPVPTSPHRSYTCMNRLVLDPDASDCGCVNGQARWFQS